MAPPSRQNNGASVRPLSVERSSSSWRCQQAPFDNIVPIDSDGENSDIPHHELESISRKKTMKYGPHYVRISKL
jgi:hypothetical protein